MDVPALIEALAIPAVAVDAEGTVVAANGHCRDAFDAALRPGLALARVAPGFDLGGLRRRRLPDLELVQIHTPRGPVAVRLTLLPLCEGPVSVLLLERRAEAAEVARRRTLDRIDAVARTIGSVRHELAGVVQSLLNGPFIVRRALARSPEEGLKHLESLDEQVEALAARLKSFDRLPAALRDPDARAIEVAELTRVVTEKRPRVRAETGALAGETVWGDHAQLECALGALLDNALESTGAAGEVRLLVAREPDCVVFRVDDGSEAPWPPAPNSIYDPFYTSKHKNLGIGLCIAFAVAERHGASLVIGPRPDGPGTRATLSLLRRGEASRTAAASGNRPRPEPDAS